MGVGAVAQPLCDRKTPDLPEQGHLELRGKATLPGGLRQQPLPPVPCTLPAQPEALVAR